MRIKRCQQRVPEGEQFTDREMEKRIKKIDSERARYHNLISNTPWGDKAGYHLCVNTTDVEIKSLIPALSAYIRCWTGETL